MTNQSAMPNHVAGRQYGVTKTVAIDLKSLNKEEKAIVKIALTKVFNLISSIQNKRAS